MRLAANPAWCFTLPIFILHEKWRIIFPASLSQFFLSPSSQHASWSQCAVWASLSEVFLTRLLIFLCRTYCSEVAVQCWSIRVPLSIFPLTHMLCVWTIALVTYFSLALWGKAFIVSPLFLNSCAYLWWFCEWCKYLSKKSLYWAANYPLIFSTLKIRKNHLSSNKKLAKFGNMSKEYCGCSSTCHTEKNIALLSEIQVTLVSLVTVMFTTCFSLKDLLTVFWFAAITVTNRWWCHEAV